jgi:hypothetical protein
MSFVPTTSKKTGSGFLLWAQKEKAKVKEKERSHRIVWHGCCCEDSASQGRIPFLPRGIQEPGQLCCLNFLVRSLRCSLPFWSSARCQCKKKRSSLTSLSQTERGSGLSGRSKRALSLNLWDQVTWVPVLCYIFDKLCWNCPFFVSNTNTSSPYAKLSQFWIVYELKQCSQFF